MIKKKFKSHPEKRRNIRTKSKMTADFSSETIQERSQWRNILKAI